MVNSILNIGCRDENNYSERSKIRIVNLSSIIGIVCMALYSVFYLSLKNQKFNLLAGVILCLMFLLLLPIYLNKFHIHKTALFITNLIVTLASAIPPLLFLGPRLGVQYFLLIIALIQFLYYSQKQLIPLIIFCILNLSLFYICEFYSGFAFPLIISDIGAIIPFQLVNIIHLSSLVLSFAIIIVIVSTLRKYAIDYQEIIKEKTGEIQQKNLKIDEQKQVLQETIATKDKFFSIIAHDLRGPISSVRDMQEMIYQDYKDMPDEEKLDILKQLVQSTNWVYELLEELLTWSRCQRGIIPFNPQQFDLNFLISNITENFKIITDKKNITIETDFDKIYSAYADINMISTVLMNILTNAVKYTFERGVIKISIEEGDTFVLVSIKDNGIGMTEQQLSNMFKIGRAMSTVGTNNEKGTGLGLIICRDFVEKNSGKMWAESAVGKGATFHFTLPKET
ncbi:MAG: HAMP domain-containing sensor histidine kinase [Candidatus Kapabacteria bacterium]|nr:HAMP domain-containing sensor histidine kinase [Candidatus Kapabacteria bacterium]